MKRIVSICLLVCTINLYAETISVTKHYTGEIHSYFQRGSNIYSLEGTTTDGYIQKFSTSYPYAGGSALNQQTEILSETGLGVVTLFSPYPSTTVKPKCWAWGGLNGTITIGETVQYPAGTPLLLQIDYFGATIGDVTENQCFREAGVANMDEEILWLATYLTSGKESYYLPVTAGQSYLFGLYERMGSQYSPIDMNDYNDFVANGVGIDFFVIIPEPATVMLLGLGGLVLARRRNFR